MINEFLQFIQWDSWGIWKVSIFEQVVFLCMLLIVAWIALMFGASFFPHFRIPTKAKSPTFMNWFERWMLRQLVSKACMRGGNHTMPVVYTEIRKTVAEMYPEDNVPTLNWSLRAWFRLGLERTAWDILADNDE